MAANSSARKKLREAQFFLARMSEAEGTERLDRDDFDFYFSAFVSAGRSVTFALQREEKVSYDAWFLGWGASLSDEERDVMRFMKDERNTQLKRAESESIARNEYVDLISHYRDRHPTSRQPIWLAPPGSPRPEVAVMRHYLKFRGNSVRATLLCLSYASLLERLVEDFDTNRGGADS